MKISRTAIAALCGLSLLCLGTGPARAASLAGAECFIDQDPGEGSAMAMTPVDGSWGEEDVAAELVLDLSGLNLKAGYHTVYCRFRNDAGQWGMARPVTSDFHAVSPNITVTGQKSITAAECFFDADPGQGQGMPCRCADGACDEAEEEIVCDGIAVSELPPGMHELYVRTRDTEGLWGTTRRYAVQTYEALRLVAGEYFIGEDPGEGNGNAIPYPHDWLWNDPGEEILFALDATPYAAGNHLLQVRVRDSQGRWSQPRCRGIGQNPCEGDFDADGHQDDGDVAVLAAAFGLVDTCEYLIAICTEDFDTDCDVDGADLAVFLSDLGRSDCPACSMTASE